MAYILNLTRLFWYFQKIYIIVFDFTKKLIFLIFQVRTAIRVCRALTGIDLSTCTQWHRFLEIHYRRQETSTKPARTETTVIFLPDIWSVMPTPEEHLDSRYIIYFFVKSK